MNLSAGAALIKRNLTILQAPPIVNYFFVMATKIAISVAMATRLAISVAMATTLAISVIMATILASIGPRGYITSTWQPRNACAIAMTTKLGRAKFNNQPLKLPTSCLSDTVEHSPPIQWTSLSSNVCQ